MVGTIIFIALPYVSDLGLLNFEMNFKDFGMFVFIYVFFIIFSASAALVFMVLAELSETVKKVIGLIMKPLYFVSGVFYSVNLVPGEYQWFFHYNPITNFLEALRQFFFHSYSTIHYDLFYMFIVTFTLMFLGLYLYKYKLKRNLL